MNDYTPSDDIKIPLLLAKTIRQNNNEPQLLWDDEIDILHVRDRLTALMPWAYADADQQDDAGKAEDERARLAFEKECAREITAFDINSDEYTNKLTQSGQIPAVDLDDPMQSLFAGKTDGRFMIGLVDYFSDYLTNTNNNAGQTSLFDDTQDLKALEALRLKIWPQYHNYQSSFIRHWVAISCILLQSLVSGNGYTMFFDLDKISNDIMTDMKRIIPKAHWICDPLTNSIFDHDTKIHNKVNQVTSIIRNMPDVIVNISNSDGVQTLDYLDETRLTVIVVIGSFYHYGKKWFTLDELAQYLTQSGDEHGQHTHLTDNQRTELVEMLKTLNNTRVTINLTALANKKNGLDEKARKAGLRVNKNKDLRLTGPMLNTQIELDGTRYGKNNKYFRISDMPILYTLAGLFGDIYQIGWEYFSLPQRSSSMGRPIHAYLLKRIAPLNRMAESSGYVPKRNYNVILFKHIYEVAKIDMRSPNKYQYMTRAEKQTVDILDQFVKSGVISNGYELQDVKKQPVKKGRPYRIIITPPKVSTGKVRAKIGADDGTKK